jgi:hypothetical protein
LVDAENCFLEDGADALVAFTKISRNATRLPAKAKRNLVDGCAALLEANGGGDAIRVSNDALDFDSQFVGWIRIGQDTRVLHDSFDDAVRDKGI